MRLCRTQECSPSAQACSPIAQAKAAAAQVQRQKWKMTRKHSHTVLPVLGHDTMAGPVRTQSNAARISAGGKHGDGE